MEIEELNFQIIPEKIVCDDISVLNWNPKIWTSKSESHWSFPDNEWVFRSTKTQKRSHLYQNERSVPFVLK